MVGPRNGEQRRGQVEGDGEGGEEGQAVKIREEMAALERMGW